MVKRSAEKILPILLCMIPLVVGLAAAWAFPIKVQVSLSKTADAVTVAKKNIFGINTKVTVGKLSLYKDAYVTGDKAELTVSNIILRPTEGTMPPMAISDKWWKDKGDLNKFVNKINSFLKSDGTTMTVKIPRNGPGRNESLLIFFLFPLTAISVILFSFFVLKLK